MYDEKAIRDLAARVRYAAGRTVISVKEHLRATGTSSGSPLRLSQVWPDDQIGEPRVRTLEAMHLRSLPFIWIVAFHRGGKVVGTWIKE